MKELDDDEIQRLLDGELKPEQEPLTAGSQKNMEQYRFLFEKLKEEPGDGLPFNFSSKVKARLQVQLNRKKDIRFYLVSAAILTLGFAAFYGLLLCVNTGAGDMLMAAASRFRWIIILGIALFLGILICDQKLVKDQVKQ